MIHQPEPWVGELMKLRGDRSTLVSFAPYHPSCSVGFICTLACFPSFCFIYTHDHIISYNNTVCFYCCFSHRIPVLIHIS